MRALYLLRTILLTFAINVAISWCNLPTIFAVAEENDSQGALPELMRDLYASFKELQPLIFERKVFLDGEQSEEVLNLLDNMKEAVDANPTELHPEVRQPGFDAIFRSLQSTLRDASQAYREGRAQWALWRLRTVTNQCTTCHTAYKVQVDFFDPSLSENVNNPLERGELFLASRQFDRARKAFLQAALDPEGEYDRMEALRKWLIIQTRVSPQPKEAISGLKKVLSTGRLLPYERSEINEWLISLASWQEEQPTSPHISDLRKSENLLHQALELRHPSAARVGTVELLRASALLHKSLEQPSIEPSQKRRALYLLGFAYSKLPLFFVNELPEFYFERCIREFPGSEDAKRAYRAYREEVLFQYTGSGGTHIPSIIKAKLHELHNKAYGLTIESNRA